MAPPPMFKIDQEVWIKALKKKGTVVEVIPSDDGKNLYKVEYTTDNRRLGNPSMVGDFFEDQLQPAPLNPSLRGA